MAVYLATFSGTLLDGAEQFSYTLAFDSVIQQDDSATLAAVTAAHAAAMGTAGFLGAYGDSTSWKNIKVAKVVNLATGALFAGVNQAVNNVGGLSTASAQPAPQLALAVSLVGGPRANGTPYRGRFYLPAPAWGSPNFGDGLLGTTVQTTILNFAATLINEINDVPSGRRVVVWSRKDATTTPVGTVRLGRVLDTIRSRRRDVPEAYSSLSISGT